MSGALTEQREAQDGKLVNSSRMTHYVDICPLCERAGVAAKALCRSPLLGIPTKRGVECVVCAELAAPGDACRNCGVTMLP